MSAIASQMEMSEYSVKTSIDRLMRDGLPAFRDRRMSTKKHENSLSAPLREPLISATIEGSFCVISFGDKNHQLKIPRNHQVHLKSILLSLLQAKLLTTKDVASVLDITVARCHQLRVRLVNNDVADALVDKRKGQKRDYLVDSSLKAELIQHFTVRTLTGYSTSSQALTEIINDIQKTNISARTIRWHMNKLGLTRIKKTLPKLVAKLKKKY